MKEANAIWIEGDLGNPIDGLKILDFMTGTMRDDVKRLDIELRAGERTKATLYLTDGRVEWCVVVSHEEIPKVDLMNGVGNTMSVRLRRALTRVINKSRGRDRYASIDPVTWGEIAEVDRHELANEKNFGEVSMRELDRALAERLEGKPLGECPNAKETKA